MTPAPTKPKTVEEMADRYAKGVTTFEDEYTNDVQAFSSGYRLALADFERMIEATKEKEREPEFPGDVNEYVNSIRESVRAELREKLRDLK
jgi:hypothetical protein